MKSLDFPLVFLSWTFSLLVSLQDFFYTKSKSDETNLTDIKRFERTFYGLKNVHWSSLSSAGSFCDYNK